MEHKSPPSIWSPALEAIVAIARDTLADGEPLLAIAFLLKEGDIDMVAAAFEDEATKDGFAETVRQRASKTKPDAICIVSEAWGLPPEYHTKEAYARHKQQYKEIADAPYKIDVLLVMLETRAGDWLGRAPIVASGAGRGIGALEWKTGRGGGRFSHLLPVLYATPEQVNAFLATARAKVLQAGFDPDMPLGPSGMTMLTMLAATARQVPFEALTEKKIDEMIALMEEARWPRTHL